MNSGSVCAVLRRAVYCLSLGLCLLEPLAGYRVYDVENPQLVCTGRLLEVCVDLLDENRLRLYEISVSQCMCRVTARTPGKQVWRRCRAVTCQGRDG